jgi:predicted tellurium resistance membrane protein TerC
VAIILGFVGVKLGAEYFGMAVSNEASLGVIVTMLSGGIGLSLATKDADEDDEGASE